MASLANATKSTSLGCLEIQSKLYIYLNGHKYVTVCVYTSKMTSYNIIHFPIKGLRRLCVKWNVTILARCPSRGH